MHYFSTNFLLLLLLIQALSANCCIEHERDALLEFKAGVNDTNSRLASWRGEKCCNWAGIRCSNQTGHVVKLNLRNTNLDMDIYGNYNSDNSLVGKISPSLIFLSDLKYLDLSFNNFNGSKFPEFIGAFRNLKYLNLSNTGLSGTIPPQLGNLSRLVYLDLTNDNNFLFGSTLNIDTWWLPNVRSLKHMEMGGVDFKDSNDWVQTLNKLSSLEVLVLFNNNLTQIPQSLPFVNFTSLRILDLSYQNFNTTIPNWVGNLTSLNELTLDSNSLVGNVPPIHSLTKLTSLSLFLNNIEGDIRELFLGKLTNYTLGKLKYVNLSCNKLVGTLMGWIGEMTSVVDLSLINNYLSGTIPIDIGNLTNLVALEISGNSLTGLVLETQLTGLLNLKYLDLSSNNIIVLLGSDWTPPFQLKYIWLSSCKLGPQFPSWLRRQVEIESLYLSDNGIDDNIPNWLWSLSSLTDLVLSNNVLRGKFPVSLIHMTKLIEMDLNSNLLEDKIPFLPRNLDYLDLSNNRLSHLPPCWTNISNEVNLANNRLSGVVPSSLSCSDTLTVVKLEKNNLSGEFPFDLQFCRGLQLLDLGENKFHGIIPNWIGETFQQLQFLRLQSNLFFSNIPSKLTHLNNLRVLDLSNNYLSGPLPSGLDNFTAMRQAFPSRYVDAGWSLNETTKGLTLEYEYEELPFFMSIDLSNNNLIGDIPPEIIMLNALVNLNLSHNHLIGSIPLEIGNITSLESLDLHMNNLSGTIPQSISALYSLAVLNFSYNNLSGSIPIGHQLQTLNDPSIYSGNPYLCGPPLEKSCANRSVRFPQNDGDNEFNSKITDDGDKWFYLFIDFGFVAGFMVVFFILLFNVKMRYTYFQMIDSVLERLYVMGTFILKRRSNKFSLI